MKRLRTIIIAIVICFGFSANSLPVAAGDDPAAVAYMKKVARSLINAQKVGTRSAFRSVISRYADLPTIAMYSLGRYRKKLKRSSRSRYYRGVNAFMGRYFANESRRYIVVQTQVNTNVQNKGSDVVVSSKVKVSTGTVYNVFWHLSKRGKGYRIADIKVLGFSLIYLQRGMFSSYVKKKGGDIEALIVALNRHY